MDGPHSSVFEDDAVKKVQNFHLIWLGAENDHGARIIGKSLHFSVISADSKGGQAFEDAPRIFAGTRNEKI